MFEPFVYEPMEDTPPCDTDRVLDAALAEYMARHIVLETPTQNEFRLKILKGDFIDLAL